MSVFATSLFRQCISDLNAKYTAIYGYSLAHTDSYVLKIDSDKADPIVNRNNSPFYLLGWAVNSFNGQLRSEAIKNNPSDFKAQDYYEIIRLSQVVYLYNPTTDYVSRDKCEIPAFQPFYGGTLESFEKFIKSVNAPSMSGELEMVKSNCDCGARLGHGHSDDNDGHSHWCKTREFKK
jgi:hypothetical protein